MARAIAITIAPHRRPLAGDFRYRARVPRLSRSSSLAASLLAVLAFACGGELDTLPIDAAPAIDAAVCGDGLVGGGEACDDGDTDDTDGCVGCAFARCGDGHLRAGVETCDDGDIRCVRCTTCAGVVDQDTGHCYTMVAAASNRAGGQAACVAAGGHLAALDTAGEWPLLAPLWTDPFAPAWLGLTRAIDGQNQWTWETGRLLAAPQARWNPNEPNDSGGIEDCVEAGGAGGGWNDIACSQTRRALCERPAWAIEPTTNHAYRMLHALRTHPEAIADCAAIGAHLATVTSAAEQAFVTTLTGRDTWIGLFQGPTEGSWFWSTGERFDFRAWGPSQPDDFQANEDCVHLAAGTGLWNDRACTTRLPFLCEVH